MHYVPFWVALQYLLLQPVHRPLSSAFKFTGSGPSSLHYISAIFRDRVIRFSLLFWGSFKTTNRNIPTAVYDWILYIRTKKMKTAHNEQFYREVGSVFEIIHFFWNFSNGGPLIFQGWILAFLSVNIKKHNLIFDT